MTQELEYYGGNGYGYSTKDGLFEVRTDFSTFFTNSDKAKAFYESLNEGKSIWDMTFGAELIECHILVEKATSK